jgi:hypothetical protein
MWLDFQPNASAATVSMESGTSKKAATPPVEVTSGDVEPAAAAAPLTPRSKALAAALASLDAAEVILRAHWKPCISTRVLYCATAAGPAGW